MLWIPQQPTPYSLYTRMYTSIQKVLASQMQKSQIIMAKGYPMREQNESCNYTL